MRYLLSASTQTDKHRMYTLQSFEHDSFIEQAASIRREFKESAFTPTVFVLYKSSEVL